MTTAQGDFPPISSCVCATVCFIPPVSGSVERIYHYYPSIVLSCIEVFGPHGACSGLLSCRDYGCIPERELPMLLDVKGQGSTGPWPSAPLMRLAMFCRMSAPTLLTMTELNPFTLAHCGPCTPCVCIADAVTDTRHNTRYPVPGQGFRDRDLPPCRSGTLADSLLGRLAHIRQVEVSPPSGEGGSQSHLSPASRTFR
jgi:hypothetical protein